MIILFLIHSQENENRINPIYLRNKQLTTQYYLKDESYYSILKQSD